MGLDDVEQQYDAVVNQCLYVSAMLHKVDHAVTCMLCFVSHPALAVGLDIVTGLEQQCDALMNQALFVSAMLYNADDSAVLLVPICCML